MNVKLWACALEPNNFCYTDGFDSPIAMQEGLILLLDVGLSMHQALLEVENVCTTLVRKKASNTLFPSENLWLTQPNTNASIG